MFLSGGPKRPELLAGRSLHTRLWFSAEEESSWIEEEQNL